MKTIDCICDYIEYYNSIVHMNHILTEIERMEIIDRIENKDIIQAMMEDIFDLYNIFDFQAFGIKPDLLLFLSVVG